VDNTLGKLFTNIPTTTQANATNVIAGTALLNKSIAQASTYVGRPVTALSLGTLGKTGLLVGVKLSCYAVGTYAPFQDTIFKIKYGTSYANSTELLNTDPSVDYKWKLLKGTSVANYPTTAGTYPIAFTWSNSESFWVDITQVSSGSKGLALTLLYYLG
jgi:hypothetical protein